MPQRIIIAILIVLGACGRCFGASLHPQDGPHADLRVVIEDGLVRYSIGVNLAFLDEAVPVHREALGEISDQESERLLEAYRRLLTEQASCVINGERVEPEFERLELFREPDPGMVVLFPKMGTRALIRAAAVMRFDAPATAESVEVTWPVYPIDQLAEQMEATSGARPRMYFEAVMTAGGKSIPARFTQAEPTIRWSRSESNAINALSDLPAPRTDGVRGGVPVVLAVSAGVSVLLLVLAATARNTPARAGGVVAALAVIAAGIALGDRLGGRIGGEVVALVSEPDAEQVFLAIHESLYRAFDYTSESDIYDRLDAAIDGELLGELYEQIRLSLLQAEEEMKLGVVTGLEPMRTEIGAIDASDRDPVGLGFDVSHRWRVDGTVYHWGHSHTRAHVYDADYRVEFTEDGWRMTEHRLRSQQRIDPDTGSEYSGADSVERSGF